MPIVAPGYLFTERIFAILHCRLNLNCGSTSSCQKKGIQNAVPKGRLLFGHSQKSPAGAEATTMFKESKVRYHLSYNFKAFEQKRQWSRGNNNFKALIFLSCNL